MGQGIHERIIRAILDARGKAAEDGDCTAEVFGGARFALRFGSEIVDIPGIARDVFHDSLSRAISGNFPAVMDCLLRDLREGAARMESSFPLGMVRQIVEDHPPAGSNGVRVFLIVGTPEDRRVYAEAFAAAFGDNEIFVDLFDIPEDHARDWQIFEGMRRPVYVSARYDLQTVDEVLNAGQVHATLAARAGREPVCHLVRIVPRGESPTGGLGEGSSRYFDRFSTVTTIRADAVDG